MDENKDLGEPTETEGEMGADDQELTLEEQIDETEIVSVVQRPGEMVWIDAGETDPDVAISMLAKAFLQLVLDELCADDEFEDEEEEEGEEETPPDTTTG